MHEELEAFDEPLGFAVVPGTVPPREAVFLGGQRVGDVWPEGDGWQAKVEDAGSALNVELDSRRAAVAVLVAIFNGHLLPPGRSIGELSARQVDLLSWRLAAALTRRHPELTLIETHPGGGQYDCLSLLEKRVGQQWRTVVDMNRLGSVHVHPGEGETESMPHAWLELAASELWQDWLDRLENVAQLRRVKTVAPSAQALAVRVLAGVLASAASDEHSWDIRNGMLDTSGGTGGIRAELFDHFPDAHAAVTRREQSDVFGEPAYRFWFVIRDDAPIACVEANGSAWNRLGSVDLAGLYADAGERVTPVVLALLGDAAP